MQFVSRHLLLELHAMTTWSFLTSHARVLLAIDRDPDIRLREIAAAVGISERRAHGIVVDLTASGYLVKRRDGRRNTYEVQRHRPLADELPDERAIGEILALLAGPDPSGRDRSDL